MAFLFKEAHSVLANKTDASAYNIEQTEDSTEDEKKESIDEDDESIPSSFVFSLINCFEKSILLSKNDYSKTDFTQEIVPPPPKNNFSI